MLSFAETDLVHRDHAIPGLAMVLDPDTFATALRRAAPDADLRTAQITYRRYKPQNFCRVAYRLDVAGAELDLDVRACRPEDLASWLGDRDGLQVTGPLGHGRIVLEDRAIVVNVFPNDLKLPQLHHLADPGKRERVLRKLLPDHPGLWQGELRCLRYRPERRYVAELRAEGETRALLKSYTPRAFTRSKHNAKAFHSGPTLRIARLLGCSDRRRLLAFEWLPGRLLFDLLAAPKLDLQAVTATGAALAALHAQVPEGLVSWTPEATIADLLSLSLELGFICPELACRADKLARGFTEQLAAGPARQCTIHGDFTAKQVLVNQQEVAIIDLDWAGRGDPAGDLGNAIAQAERCALSGELSATRVELFRDALLEGYARTNRPLPERITLYTALELFRRTRFPFRAREPDWPQRTEALLARAEAIWDMIA